MQEVLVVISVLGAVAYLGWFIYKNYFSKKSKCDSCVVNKLYEAKIDKARR